MNIDRLLPIVILMLIILIGFIDYVVKLRKIISKLDYTNDYKNKFVEYINCLSKKSLNNDLYD